MKDIWLDINVGESWCDDQGGRTYDAGFKRQVMITSPMEITSDNFSKYTNELIKILKEELKQIRHELKLKEAITDMMLYGSNIQKAVWKV